MVSAIFVLFVVDSSREKITVLSLLHYIQLICSNSIQFSGVTTLFMIFTSSLGLVKECSCTGCTVLIVSAFLLLTLVIIFDDWLGLLLILILLLLLLLLLLGLDFWCSILEDFGLSF